MSYISYRHNHHHNKRLIKIHKNTKICNHMPSYHIIIFNTKREAPPDFSSDHTYHTKIPMLKCISGNITIF